MREDSAALAADAPPQRAHTRVRHGLRHPHNWYQLVKFCAVGGSGYVVNLCVFAACVELLSMHHLAAATCAFAVAGANNVGGNRHWTRGAAGGPPGVHAPRCISR